MGKGVYNQYQLLLEDKYKCELQDGDGICCPAENECLADDTITPEVKHSQCNIGNTKAGKCTSPKNGQMFGTCHKDGATCFTNTRGPAVEPPTIACESAGAAKCEERRCTECTENNDCRVPVRTFPLTPRPQTGPNPEIVQNERGLLEHCVSGVCSECSTDGDCLGNLKCRDGECGKKTFFMNTKA